MVGVSFQVITLWFSISDDLTAKKLRKLKDLKSGHTGAYGYVWKLKPVETGILLHLFCFVSPF